jgi:hypothetical protein
MASLSLSVSTGGLEVVLTPVLRTIYCIIFHLSESICNAEAPVPLKISFSAIGAKAGTLLLDAEKGEAKSLGPEMPGAGVKFCPCEIT